LPHTKNFGVWGLLSKYFVLSALASLFAGEAGRKNKNLPQLDIKLSNYGASFGFPSLRLKINTFRYDKLKKKKGGSCKIAFCAQRNIKNSLKIQRRKQANSFCLEKSNT